MNDEVPDAAAEVDFMRSFGGRRESEDAPFVGHSEVRKREFPSTIRVSPEGYQ